MRIAILSQANNFHCQKWSQALADAGATVFVYGFTPFENKNVKIRTLNTYFGYRYLDFWLTAPRLRMMFYQDKIDVVHPLHLTPFGTWGVLAAGKRPVVAAAIGADVLEYSSHNQIITRKWENSNRLDVSSWKKIKHQFFKWQVQQVVNQAKLITADNQTLIESLKMDFSVDPQKLLLLRWGIEPELFCLSENEKNIERKRWHLSDNQKVCLIPRGANYFYQADIILEAVQKSLQSGLINWKFIILSAGYIVAETIRATAKQMESQFPANFSWVPTQLSRIEMARLWQITDAFINAPSYDGFSAALNEGRFVGAIPIYNQIPAHIELLQDGYNGILVHPFDAENLHKTLLNLPQSIQNQEVFKKRNQHWVLNNAQLKPAAKIMLNKMYEIL